jgi:hypothetical protein
LPDLFHTPPLPIQLLAPRILITQGVTANPPLQTILLTQYATPISATAHPPLQTVLLAQPVIVEAWRGGGPSQRDRAPWQKPSPFVGFDPNRVDLSKLPRGVADIWLLNEGGGTRVQSLIKGHTGLLTGSWTGTQGGPGVNFEANSNTGGLNDVASANIQTTQSTPEALGLVGGHEFSYEVLIRHETLTWGFGGSNTGVGKSEMVALDGTGTIHEDGLFNGAIDIGCICIEAYTTVANPIVGAWRTFADFNHTLPNGKWVLVHCVWRYGGSDGFGKGHIFFDGKEVGYQLQETPTSDGTLDSRGLPLTIGSALDVTHTNIGDDPWPGMMAHLIIWNRGLTDAEIHSRVRDGYDFIREPQPKHTWFLSPVVGTGVTINTLPRQLIHLTQYAPTGMGVTINATRQQVLLAQYVPPVAASHPVRHPRARPLPQQIKLSQFVPTLSTSTTFPVEQRVSVSQFSVTASAAFVTTLQTIKLTQYEVGGAIITTPPLPGQQTILLTQRNPTITGAASKTVALQSVHLTQPAVVVSVPGGTNAIAQPALQSVHLTQLHVIVGPTLQLFGFTEDHIGVPRIASGLNLQLTGFTEDHFGSPGVANASA